MAGLIIRITSPSCCPADSPFRQRCRSWLGCAPPHCEALSAACSSAANSAGCGSRCCAWEASQGPQQHMPWVQQRSWALYSRDRSTATAAVHSMRSAALSQQKTALRGRSVLCLLASDPRMCCPEPDRSTASSPQAAAGLSMARLRPRSPDLALQTRHQQVGGGQRSADWWQTRPGHGRPQLCVRGAG